LGASFSLWVSGAVGQMGKDQLSPTVTRILDEFSEALKEDADLDQSMVDRLDELLKSGKIPKVEDFDNVLLLPTDAD
jgi:hypothetical protein